MPRLPIPGTQFQCDIEYYLPRIDSVFIEPNGAINLQKGESSDSPLPPPDLALGMRLYDIHLPPYTFSIKNAKIRKHNHHVYRMKDISAIDRRIDRLEDLVTLSLLCLLYTSPSPRDSR